MKNNKNSIYTVIAVIIVGALAFYGGIKYGEAKTSSTAAAGFAARSGGTGSFTRGGQAGANRTRGGGFVTGSILSKTDTTITVKLPTGGSSIVITSPSTTVLKSVAGSMTDLAVGQNILVQGSANSDGSVTAQSIQVRPDMPQQQTKSSPQATQ